MPDQSQPAVAERPAFTHAQVRSIIFGVLLAILMGALDQTIISVALPVLSASLSLWVLNIALPSAAGLLLLPGLRVLREKVAGR